MKDVYMTSNKQKLSVINPDASGIDIGFEESYVCVPADRGKKTGNKIRV